jgi:hypothetical protein
VGTDVKIVIERQFKRIRRAELRRLFQPQAMFCPMNAQDGVQTILRLSYVRHAKIRER